MLVWIRLHKTPLQSLQVFSRIFVFSSMSPSLQNVDCANRHAGSNAFDEPGSVRAYCGIRRFLVFREGISTRGFWRVKPNLRAISSRLFQLSFQVLRESAELE